MKSCRSIFTMYNKNAENRIWKLSRMKILTQSTLIYKAYVVDTVCVLCTWNRHSVRLIPFICRFPMPFKKGHKKCYAFNATGNGNCLYNSYARMAYGSEDNAGLVRLKMAHVAATNFDDIVQRVSCISGIPWVFNIEVFDWEYVSDTHTLLCIERSAARWNSLWKHK